MTGALTTLQQVEAIAAMPDAEERNYQITQSYYEFSEALRSGLDDPKNANWSTFAAWASCTAGRSIREEDLPQWGHRLVEQDRTIQQQLGGPLGLVLKCTGVDLDLLDNLGEILKKVSRQVGDGNRKVYLELGPLFARFLKVLSGDMTLDAFLGELKPGPVEQDGQELLRLAFQSYFDARASDDKKHTAELMLLGNCRIGLHEQTRLQPNIKGAVTEPVAELWTNAVLRPLPARIALRVLSLVGISRQRVYAIASKEWEALATRYAMNLALPDGDEIPLGGDNIHWPARTAPDLEELKDPEVRRVVGEFDDNLEKLRAQGAQNWTDLRDRMGYIVELFRSQQQNARLFTEPPGKVGPRA